MAEPADDGTPRQREYQATMRKLRKRLAKSPRGYDLSDDAPAVDRLRYWRLKEIVGRLTMQGAISKIRRAQADLGGPIDVRSKSVDYDTFEYQIRTSGPLLARESGPRDETGLEPIERRLATIEQQLVLLAEGKSSRAELESVREDAKMAAEGHAEVAPKFDTINRQLKALDSRITRLELRLLRLENPRGGGTSGPS